MNAPDGRLQRLLGGEELAELRRRLRRHFARASPGQACDAFRVTGLTQQEHAALASLTGRPPRFTGSLQIDVPAVDLALQQAGIAASLQSALEALDGPIVNATAARAERDRLWAGVTEGCRHSELASYLRFPAAVGLLKRLSGNDAAAASVLCSQVEAVLRRLPAPGVTRAQLAAETLGDPHALDNGRAVATLVLAVWRQGAVTAAPVDQDASGSTGDSGSARQDARAEKAREIWARAGVLVNELARPALVLNLPIGDEGALADPSGEPGYLSLRLLLRVPPMWAVEGRTVFVCENPNLLAIAADRLGPCCHPLVCTDGMPAAAQDRLLTQLARAGALLHYHGDFDWPGLHIGNHVMQEYGARPWRFGSSDYCAAVRTLPLQGRPLVGPPVAAAWDVGLASAMQRYNSAVAEESVADTLLQDLYLDTPLNESGIRTGGSIG